MTARDKHIAQKRKEIEKIAKQQVRLIMKAANTIAKPSKHMDVNLRRIGKMIVIAMQVRMLETQKQIIASQPIPKGEGFAPGALGIVGDGGPESIDSKSVKIKVK